MRFGGFYSKVFALPMFSSPHEVLNLFPEKGTGPWPPAREPLLKKLKISSKSSVPRSASVSSKGTSTVDSPSSIESSSDSDPEGDNSEYETNSELEVEPEEPSPLPSNRPLDPLKAIEYDTIKAVWAKRKVSLSGVVIRTALSEYWNIMKGIRDRWKAEVVTLQQASEKKEKAKVTEYERRAANQRKLLETCIRLTLKHGHPDIIEKYVSFLFLYTIPCSPSQNAIVLNICTLGLNPGYGFWLSGIFRVIFASGMIVSLISWATNAIP